MNSTRIDRVKWLANELSKGVSNGAIVDAYVKRFPGLTRTCGNRELREVLTRFAEIEDVTIAQAKARFLRLGFDLLKEARENFAFGPAVAQFRTLAQMAGALDPAAPKTAPRTGTSGDDTGTSAVPPAEIVRERIASLLADPGVAAAAEQVSVDLALARK